MMFDEGEYSHSPEMSLESLSGGGGGFNPLSKKKKKRCKNKKRFSDEQIRSLETMFESESKLEPRKKMQLARDLGLQPRQVAIWFQNKRARWKSKQLERDYSILRSNYNNLTSRFETLKKEKQALVIQLQKLNNVMHKSREENQDCSRQAAAAAENSVIGEQLLDIRDDVKSREFAAKPSLSMERLEHGIGVLSDDDSSIKAEYFGLDEEPELLKMVEPAESSLTSPENWGSLDSDCLLDESAGTSYQWWDFWS